MAGLDGLRALAVTGVLLYHADVPWALGGFIGVDVFFVLSGYLVTTIVLERLERTGSLGFRQFWGARLRRLAPAELSMIVTVIVALAITHRDELAGLRGQVLAALSGTTNWYLIATEGSYFEQLGRPPVFRHLWSLAIELQFYLGFPLILAALSKRLHDRLDQVVGGLTAAILASTIYMAWLFHPGQDPTRAYFDTFARLAAPLMGALVAVLWRPRALRRGRVAAHGMAYSAGGAAALVGVAWIMHVAGDRSAFMYRGGFLLVALLTAVMVMGLTHPASVLGSRWALGNPALVAIGLRSYGLYLWHWPIFVLLRPRIDVGWSWGTTLAVRLALTIAVTEACYQLIERPWHERRPEASISGIRRSILQPSGAAIAPRLLAVGSIAAVLAAVVIIAVPHRSSDEIADSLRSGEAALATTTTSDGPLPRATPPTRADDDGSTSSTSEPAPGTSPVTLIGDSVMVGAAPAVMAAFGPRANIDAKVSRQAAEIPPIIRQLDIEQRLASTVVVQVGINGTVTEENLRDVVAAAGGRRVLIINARVPRSWESGNNDLVRRLAPTLPRTDFIDWYRASNTHRDWFLRDGVHLTPAGRSAYAGIIRAAVDRAPDGPAR